MPQKIKLLDEYCNSCNAQLNSWDKRLSNTLKYKYAVCEQCIAKEYDRDVEWLRNYFERVFGMRPCLGI